MYYCGIDVAKREHTVIVLDAQRPSSYNAAIGFTPPTPPQAEVVIKRAC